MFTDILADTKHLCFYTLRLIVGTIIEQIHWIFALTK